MPQHHPMCFFTQASVTGLDESIPFLRCPSPEPRFYTGSALAAGLKVCLSASKRSPDGAQRNPGLSCAATPLPISLRSIRYLLARSGLRFLWLIRGMLGRALQSLAYRCSARLTCNDAACESIKLHIKCCRDYRFTQIGRLVSKDVIQSAKFFSEMLLSGLVQGGGIRARLWTQVFARLVRHNFADVN